MSFAGLALVVVLSGCARMGTGSGDAESNPLRLFMRLQKEELRPQDPLIVEVLLANVSGEEEDLAPLSHRSLKFWFTDGTTPLVQTVVPVHPEDEPPSAPLTLPADALASRTFVFTRLTEDPGTYSLSAVYSSTPEEMNVPRIQASAKAIEYDVAGEAVLHRDGDGILLKEDAIAIARDRAGIEEGPVRAKLIVNEAGLLDWFVVLAPRDEAEETGVLVNPYLGGVRSFVDPDEVSTKEARPVFPPYSEKQAAP